MTPPFEVGRQPHSLQAQLNDRQVLLGIVSILLYAQISEATSLWPAPRRDTAWSYVYMPQVAFYLRGDPGKDEVERFTPCHDEITWRACCMLPWVDMEKANA